MKKILIPIDGSENSKKAILEGKKLAELFKSEIILLYVHRFTDMGGSYSDVYTYFDEDSIKKIGKEIIDEGLTMVGDNPISVKGKTEFGDPADMIITVAEREQVDLIVMGSRGLTGIKRFVLGSVSNKVLNHAPTSVLIIR